jgi:hypothetical protein
MQIHPSISPVVVQWLAPEKSFYQEWDFWVSFGTLLLAFITAWLAWETRGLRKDSAKAIGASEETARSAAASAAIAQAAMERSLRAYVTVERPEPFNQNAAKIPHGVSVSVINTGQTPARKLEKSVYCNGRRRFSLRLFRFKAIRAAFCEGHEGARRHRGNRQDHRVGWVWSAGVAPT